MTHRYGPLAFALLAGALLVWLAVPRLVAAALTAPYDQVFRDLSQTRPDRPDAAVPFDSVVATIKSREAGLRWLENGRMRAELGSLELLVAGLAGYDDPRGRLLLDRAIASHQRGLAQDPAQPFAWTRLAHAEFARHGITPELNPLLRMAIRTAPYEPQLVLDRLDLAFVAWQRLDNQTRALVYDQVVIAARFYEKRLAQVARRRDALPILEEALREHEGLYRRVGFYYRRG